MSETEAWEAATGSAGKREFTGDEGWGLLLFPHSVLLQRQRRKRFQLLGHSLLFSG